MEYSINTNYTEIIAGTSNIYSPVYTEAANNIEKNTDKGVAYLKNFLQSIENISDKDAVKDQRISESKGNIKNFKGYDNIESALEFLNKNLNGVQGVKDCADMKDLLDKYQPQYSEAYEKKAKLNILEYESAVYMLVTNLSMILANNMDVVANGTEIRIQKKSATTFGVIPKTMSDLVKQMKDANHKSYLDEINKSVDNVKTEGVVLEDVDLGKAVSTVSEVGKLAYDIVNNLFGTIKGAGMAIKKIRKSVFGIVPIIRSVAYLRYKKKADTILSLDQQVAFIQANIEQLEKRTNIDPKQKEQIIKKQKAAVEKYQKKAEKLRAQLMETEKDAATAISKEDPQLKNTDDDFVLESGKTINDIFGEETQSFQKAETEEGENNALISADHH